jgi:hypothetical protein
MRRVLVVLGLALLAAAEASAWPAEAATAVTRDARRLVPRSLSGLLGDREPQVQQAMARLPPALGLAQDLPRGRLSPDTIAAIDGELARAVELLRQRRVSEGLVQLGALARVTADLSDPVLAVGPEGWPSGLSREYYALFSANLVRMPVVRDDTIALEQPRAQLPALWQSLLQRSREQVPTIREELIRDGRVVSHARLDYRSPAWAVASLAYSRAVTATAATWLAGWREAHGDMTRIARPRVLVPLDAPAAEPAAEGRRDPAEAP